MSSEVILYRQNRIKEAINSTNNTIINLQSILMANIKNIQTSRFINNNSKTLQINHLINKYNIQVISLKNALINIMNKWNTYLPEFMVDKQNIKNKKALLIGVNYLNTPYQLNGCIDDTTRIKDFLSKKNFTQFNVITDLTNVKPSKTNILNEFKNFVSNAENGDVLFFYFSGHGSYINDRNKDEIDGRDEMIVSSDLQMVLDDELKSILNVHLKSGVTIIGMFDSCHSGTMFDLKYCYNDSTNFDKYSENNLTTECSGNVLLISGCMDAQTSAEALIDGNPQGAMSWSFMETLNKSSDISWRELLKSMRELLKKNNFTQIPQMATDSIYNIDSKLFI